MNSNSYIKEQLSNTYEYLQNLEICFLRPDRFVGWIENEIMNQNIIRFPEYPLTLNAWGPIVQLSAENLRCEDFEVDIYKQSAIEYIMNQLCDHILGMSYESFSANLMNK